MTIRRRNPRHQGDIGLAAAIEHFASTDHDLALPLGESQPWDLIVEPRAARLAGPLRVQVKTSTRRTPYGSFEVKLETRGGNRSWDGRSKVFGPTLVELLFVLTDGDERYVIPTSAVVARRSITLGHKWARYRVTSAGRGSPALA